MSSGALTTLVPTLDGTNYLEWSAAMKCYLQSQGFWRVLKKTQVTLDPKSDNSDDVEKWEDENSKAYGCIALRLHHTIRMKYTKVENAGKLWDELATLYGSPGISGAFLTFRAAMQTQIPANADPALAYDQIMTLFARLEEEKLVIPANLQTMILLSKVPQYMENVIQVMLQEAKIEDLEPSKLRNAILVCWDQKNGRNNQNQNQANRLSNIPQGPRNQGFQQQNFGGDGFQGGGRRGRRRGGRGKGRGGGQQGQQQAVPAQDQQGPPTAGPSNQQKPTPTVNLSSGPNLFLPQTLSPLDFGTMASPVDLTPRTPYPSFNATLALARELGERSMSQTLQTLETLEMTRELSRDPHPHKKQQVDKDDEVVSLGESSDNGQVDQWMEDVTAALGYAERYASKSKSIQSTNNYTATNYHTRVTRLDCLNNNIQCLTIRDSLSTTEAEWILDSGASRHFTFEINDFVEYEGIIPVAVQTATNTTSIIGKGTVILKIENGSVRIHPVYHIPD